MKFTPAPLDGLLLIEPKLFGDSRGWFTTTFQRELFAANGICDDFNQDNLSQSKQGTLRGMHYQLEPHAQAKLVRVVSGKIFDVAVDIRRGSPTFGKWAGYELSAANGRALYIPVGFAHGFLALEESLVAYKCSGAYAPQSDRSLLWSDPAIAIRWPAEPNLGLISDKDKSGAPLDTAEINFNYSSKS